MSDSFAMSLLQAQALATAQELRRCNDVSATYGLSLSETQIQSLVQDNTESLRYTGRIELYGSMLPRLVYAFCDSPYINREDYRDTLAALQELFYTFKNESEDSLTDDDLIEALKRIFDGKAKGSLEYLENLTVSDLYRALTGNNQEEDEYDD